MKNPSSKKYLSDDTLRTIDTLIKESGPDMTSDETKENYEAEIRRILAKLRLSGRNTPSDFLAALADTRSKSTYYRRRAATNYFLKSKILVLIANMESASETPEIAKIYKSIEYFAALKNLLTETAGVCQVEDPRPRKSKRALLGFISRQGDFRERLYTQFKNSKYQLPFLVAAVSGARPHEMQHGVEVRLQDGFVVIQITGAKVKDSQGQPIRTIKYETANESNNFLLSEIVRLMGTTAERGITVAVDSKVNFTSALRRAGKALWPNKNEITPYVLRHAISSQWKQQLDPDDVSIALGHTSSKTRTRYGQAQLMRGSGQLAPASVRGTRPVRTAPRPRSPSVK